MEDEKDNVVPLRTGHLAESKRRPGLKSVAEVLEEHGFCPVTELVKLLPKLGVSQQAKTLRVLAQHVQPRPAPKLDEETLRVMAAEELIRRLTDQP